MIAHITLDDCWYGSAEDRSQSGVGRSLSNVVGEAAAPAATSKYLAGGLSRQGLDTSYL